MARQGSGHELQKANVYVKLKLLGKDVSCLLDSGCRSHTSTERSD